VEAFDRMRARHGDVAEFIVADRLPIAEYLEVIERTNVIVDQALSYTYGMNAVISMAMGKVVMSGSEPEILSIYGGNCPVINITPDVDAICGRIESILARRDELPALGQASRQFVEREHAHVRVAEKFLGAWTSR
jgi:hypothetical protein